MSGSVKQNNWKLFRKRTGLEEGKGVRLDIAKWWEQDIDE